MYFLNKVRLLRSSLSEKLYVELPEWLKLSGVSAEQAAERRL